MHKVFKQWRLYGSAILLLSIASMSGIFLLHRHWKLHSPSLPDSMGLSSAPDLHRGGWKAYGGAWQLKNEVMQNLSDERGARLLNGNTHWKNYMVEADVETLGSAGDAGLLLRSTEEEIGVDSYHGYFAGIRDLDDTLILGRADFGWHEFRAIPIPGGVSTNRWYHLKFIAYECTLAASVTTQEAHTVTASVRDPRCLQQGRFGLQSYAISASWRNLRLEPATRASLQNLLGAQAPADIEKPIPLPAIINPETIRRSSLPIQRELHGYASHLPFSSIANLHLLPPTRPSRATVHGIVTLTMPHLFVQDATGGMEIAQADVSPSVQIGDSVEVSGNVQPRGLVLTMQQAHIRPIWSHASTPPIAVSALQAATGNFMAQYIETKARLLHKQRLDDQSMVLTLSQDAQTFKAIAQGQGTTDALHNLQVGSLLLLHGICVSDSADTKDEIPFALLMRSPNDWTLLEPPPWWNLEHAIESMALLLLAAFGVRSILNAAMRSKFRAVMEERERLALEMHDTLAQSFAGLGFQLEGLCEEATLGTPLRQQLESTLHLAQIGHLEARRNIAALHPANLEQLGLFKSLEQAARILVQNGAIAIVTSSRGMPRKIPLRTSVPLLRIGQEAVANAIRHANPKTIQLRIVYGADFVRMTVCDDGIGIKRQQEHTGFGLRGMCNRARDLHAILQIRSAPGRGTVISVRVKMTRSLLSHTWIHFPVLSHLLEKYL